MNLGAFSVSLAVKDLSISRAFYEKLGFNALGGDESHGYLILNNDDHVIGLFQGMFEKNILTFNPGWDQSAQETEPFTDIRDIQANLEARGIRLDSKVEEGTTGAGSIMLSDPDGNQILIDQHR